VARELDEDELIGNWTLVGDELEELSGRRGATKLGFALLLRFYAVHGRFPTRRSELPDQAVAHVARLVDVPMSDLGFYEWGGRTIKAHRTDIRRYFGFRECSVADADKAAEWLAANACEKERQPDRVREELLAYLKREQVEPPTRDRIRRVIGTAMRRAEQALTTRIASRVLAEAAARLRALITRAADPGAEEDAGPGDDGALFGAATSPSTPAGRPPGSSPTRPSPPGRPHCAARGRPRSRRTPRTSPPSTRTSSTNGTRGTGGRKEAS
jgi:hypothetical protein